MPNWCSNYASFEGERAKEMLDLFKEGQNYNEETYHGWAPKFLVEPDRYMFDISEVQLNDNKLTLRFDTKWAPSIEDFEKICNEYNVAGELDYEELAMGIYGRFVYEPGLGGKDVYLDGTEIDSIEYNEEDETYHYDGMVSDSQYEFLEHLLEKKMRA